MRTHLVSSPYRYTQKMKCRSLLAAAALVPLALGDYSYDYSVPTMAPTTETAPPTLEVCPELAGLTEADCPGGKINYTIPACNLTGLVAYWTILVVVSSRKMSSGTPVTSTEKVSKVTARASAAVGAGVATYSRTRPSIMVE